MQIAFHIGANCTDEDRLLKSALKNASALLQAGTAVPGPGKYRKLIRQAVESLGSAQPKPGARDVMIDAIVDDDDVSRVVLSNDNFMTVPKRIFDHGLFYHQAEDKVRALHKLFPDDDITLFMGMRHPAGFLQEAAARSGVTRLREYLGVMHPLEIRWSDVIHRIKRAAPQTPLYVWCNEDTPLIWEELIRLYTGMPDHLEILGKHDLLSGIVSKEGLEALELGASALAPDDIDAQQELIATVLETYALPDAVEEDIAYPELPEAVIDAMTDSYENDLELIAGMEGVELILPFE